MHAFPFVANQPGFVTSLVPKPVYINKNNITKLMIPCPAARVELTKAVLFRFDEVIILELIIAL
jgi:hypothetical protein